MRQSCRDVLLLLLPIVVACGREGRAAASPPPPRAEFLLTAGDSTFWVTTGEKGVQVLAAPIEIIRVEGRFLELYVVDDERSFHGADLVGQSVYGRDLATGDSAVVFTDSIIPALARQYAKTHPNDRPVEGDEEPDDDAVIRATATLDLGEAFGPFVSYALHTDIERSAGAAWHTGRRGVIDLRTRRTATLADVVGAQAPAIVRQVTRPIDPTSFSIVTMGGAPGIAFGPDTAIRIADPAWWPSVVPSLPTSSADGSRKIWRQNAYSVIVRYEKDGSARLAIRDSTSREWPMGSVSAPARRIEWLDQHGVDASTRQALLKAFREASSATGEGLIAMNFAPAGK